MRPGMRQPPSASLVPRLLLALPLGLAAFALLLQLTSHRTPVDSAAFGLFNEREFISRSDHIPRLERQLRKSGARGAEAATPLRLPVPQRLGNDSWAFPQASPTGPNIAFIVTTAEAVPQIRVWLAYHRAIGVSTFFLFAEGAAAAPEAVAALRRERGVTVILRDEKLIESQKRSRIWNESWLSAFFNKPCNHELFVKQSLNMEMGIKLARSAGAEWLLHIDTDELIYPGGSRDYSLQQVLASVPEDVDLLVFPNYESLAETADVEDVFSEVSLFKRNYAHVVSDHYFDSYGLVARGNPNYFTTYGNGKSAARVIDGLRPNGAHRWHNYYKEPNEWTSEQSAVLHFTYNRFSDLIARRDRCDCAPTPEDAERCFILPFDRVAFLEASLRTDEKLMEWFKERLVWDDTNLVLDLLKQGLFVRLYAPQILVRGFAQALLEGSAGGSAPLGDENYNASDTSDTASIAARSVPSEARPGTGAAVTREGQSGGVGLAARHAPPTPRPQPQQQHEDVVVLDDGSNVAQGAAAESAVKEQQRREAIGNGGSAGGGTATDGGAARAVPRSRAAAGGTQALPKISTPAVPSRTQDTVRRAAAA